MGYLIEADAIRSPQDRMEAGAAHYIMEHVLSAPGWLKGHSFAITAEPFRGGKSGYAEDHMRDIIVTVECGPERWAYRVATDAFGQRCLIKSSCEGDAFDLLAMDDEEREFSEYELSNTYSNEDGNGGNNE